MQAIRSVLGLIAEARSPRVFAGVKALMVAGMLVLPVRAGAGGSRVSLRALAEPSGGVTLEWTRSAGPVESLGWHVERQWPGGEGVRLTGARVEAGLFDPPGMVYRFHDAATAARAGDEVRYRLVEVDPELREGISPFEVLVVEATPESAAEKSPARMQPSATVSATIGHRVRIAVTNEGLVRLAASNIAAVLQGYDVAQVTQAIAQTQFALSCGGEPVAWRAEPGGGGLLFYGQPYRDTYTDRNVYWLEPGAGLAMGQTNRATAAVAGDPWFWETARAEQNLYFMPYLPGGVEDDYFIWAGQQLVSPTATWTWTAQVPLIHAHPALKTGTVTAWLASAYDGAPALDNRTRLSAAGQGLDDRRWAGDARLVQTGTATNLGGTSATVAIELRREPDVTTTTVLIDAVEVRYARRLRAQGNQLLFRAEAGTNTVTVRGFSTAAIRVFDVEDPLRPVEIAATVAPEGASDWRASWAVEPAWARRYLAVSQSVSPERIEGSSDAGWSGELAGAPHVVIAPRALTNAAAALVSHRQQQGLGSILVPLEDLYDAFAFGRRDPRVIPQFLAHARAQWDEPPVYVCLAGDGHLDYRDHFGQAATRPNHVPPLLERLPYDAGTSGTRVTLGLDNSLADIDGDGVPDFAIGRLPAQTASALTAMINRIVAHEASEAWKNKVLLISDKDENNIFGLARERLAGHVPPGMTLQRLGHTLATAPETMRASFIQAMNSGPVLGVYFGHANNVGISSPYFFEHSFIRSYMTSLTNRVRPPVLLAGTCMLNDFAPPHPNNRCLGKGFLDTAPGGAVAVWASATEASLAMAESTAGMVLDKLFENTAGRLGDLIGPALDIQAQSASPWTVRASILLGDPGLRIRTHLFLDKTPPVVQITSPGPGAVHAAATDRLDLAGTAADSSGLKRVVIRNSRTGGEVLATGTANWSCAGLALAEGTNPITAVAFDSAENSATASVQVVHLLAPTIQFTIPTTAATFVAETGQIDLAGTAADSSGVAAVVVRNSRTAGDWIATGTTNWSVAGMTLAAGTNWISAIAIDGVGNSATSMLRITCTVLPPPEGEFRGVRRVTGGLELNWQGVAGRTYRIAMADSMFGPFSPLDGAIQVADENGWILLPMDFEARQKFFRLIWTE